jgi:adenylylsulfate reductase subunit B
VTWEWKLLIQNCTGCGICADICPEDAIKMTRDMAYPESVPGKCDGCMTCLKECPFDALEVEELLSSVSYQ